MKQPDQQENNILGSCIIFLVVFLFIGWYTAESDNEILRKELSLYKGEEIQK